MAREKTALIALFVFSLVITVLRFIVAAKIGLAADEAYYWRWSLDLFLAYPDHPPLTAWLIRLGTGVLGHTSIGVRSVATLLSFLSTWTVYLVARGVGLPPLWAVVAAAVSCLMPAAATAAIIMTPDTPLGFFWLLGVLALVRLAGGASPRYWILFGLALGLGGLSKYSALMMPVLVPASRAFGAGGPFGDRRHRCCRALAGLTALLVAAPHLVAVASSGFFAVSFQLDHLLGRLSGGGSLGALSFPERLGALLGGQLGLLTPIVAGWLVVGGIQKKRRGEGERVLAAALLLPMLTTGVVTLFTHPEQNWASLGHPVAPIMALLAVRRRYLEGEPARERRGIAWMWGTLASCLIIFILIHVHVLSPFLPLSAKRDPTSRLHGWEALSRLAGSVAAADAVVCDNYGLASQVAWHHRFAARPVTVASPDRGPSPPAGRWLLLSQEGDWGAEALSAICAEEEVVGAFSLVNPGSGPYDRVTAKMGVHCTGIR